MGLGAGDGRRGYCSAAGFVGHDLLECSGTLPELMQGQQNASMLEGSSFLLKDVSGLISFLLLCSERCSRKNFEDQFGEQN